MVTEYCVNPRYFGHNLGSVLMDFVKQTVASVGYKCMVGPVQTGGLDLYMAFAGEDKRRLDLHNLGPSYVKPKELLVRGEKLFF